MKLLINLYKYSTPTTLRIMISTVKFYVFNIKSFRKQKRYATMKARFLFFNINIKCKTNIKKEGINKFYIAKII